MLILIQTQIRVDSSGSYFEVAARQSEQRSAGKKLQTAQISLNDCLACRCALESPWLIVIHLFIQRVYHFGGIGSYNNAVSQRGSVVFIIEPTTIFPGASPTYPFNLSPVPCISCSLGIINLPSSSVSAVNITACSSISSTRARLCPCFRYYFCSSYCSPGTRKRIQRKESGS